MLIPQPSSLVIHPEEQRAHNRAPRGPGQKAAWKRNRPPVSLLKARRAPGLAATRAGLSEARLGEGEGNTRQKSRGKEKRREEKRRDFYKTHPSPNPGPRRDTDTYRLTVPTYNPTTTMDPLRAKKRKKKGVTGRGWGEERAKESGPPPARGNERKSGNDESIVPVQRAFLPSLRGGQPIFSTFSPRSSSRSPSPLPPLRFARSPLFLDTASRPRHSRDYSKRRWLHAYGQLGRLPTVRILILVFFYPNRNE